MCTTAEENYLKAIFKLSYEQKNGVTTSSLAEHLATKASSVTDMVQKLADKELVNYIKYQGVTLTPKGEKIAIQLIRKHRLWELFLFQNLGFKWDEIHEIAEELEHIKSDLLVERLDQFLNYPLKDPHGDPIPDQEGNFPKNNSIPLSRLNTGTKGIVVGVNDKSSSFLIYLVKIGIQLGTEIEILEWHEFDHSVDVRINALTLIHLSYQSAQNILMSEKST
ncbi:MAG TPA: iron-dependent repressor [Prolixibacteraceae bacterium]|jgi:DtxR family Mn-dependent transcriptional regulator|nr:iron-dependent repressor [Prolixibacteraceae bacterium]